MKRYLLSCDIVTVHLSAGKQHLSVVQKEIDEIKRGIKAIEFSRDFAKADLMALQTQAAAEKENAEKTEEQQLRRETRQAPTKAGKLLFFSRYLWEDFPVV